MNNPSWWTWYWYFGYFISVIKTRFKCLYYKILAKSRSFSQTTRALSKVFAVFQVIPGHTSLLKTTWSLFQHASCSRKHLMMIDISFFLNTLDVCWKTWSGCWRLFATSASYLGHPKLKRCSISTWGNSMSLPSDIIYSKWTWKRMRKIIHKARACLPQDDG